MEIRTETEIQASPSVVWRVLSDFERYPEWNPFIVTIRGELAAGARLSATLSMPDSAAEHRIRPLVVRCEPERELRWLEHLWMKGLYDGEHFFRLEERDGRTRFIHGQDISGLLVRFAMNTVTHTTRGFAYMNQALKQRVESGKVSRG